MNNAMKTMGLLGLLALPALAEGAKAAAAPSLKAEAAKLDKVADAGVTVEAVKQETAATAEASHTGAADAGTQAAGAKKKPGAKEVSQPKAK